MMKGTIFTIFNQMIEERHGMDTCLAFIDKANSGGFLFGTKTFADDIAERH